MEKEALIKKMIDAIDEIVQDKTQIILKWQLFEKPIDGNIPLTHDSFDYAVPEGVFPYK